MLLHAGVKEILVHVRYVVGCTPVYSGVHQPDIAATWHTPAGSHCRIME